MLDPICTRVELFGEGRIQVHVPTEPIAGQLRILNGNRAELDQRIQSEVQDCLALARRTQRAYVVTLSRCAEQAALFNAWVKSIDWIDVEAERARRVAELCHNAGNLELAYDTGSNIVGEVSRVMEPFLSSDLQMIAPVQASRDCLPTFTGLSDADAAKASGLHALCDKWPETYDGALDLFFYHMRRDLAELERRYGHAITTARGLIQARSESTNQMQELIERMRSESSE